MGCKQVESKRPNGAVIVQAPIIRDINIKFMIEENKIIKKVVKSSDKLVNITKEIESTMIIPKHNKINYFWKTSKITDLSIELGKLCSENDMVIDVIKAGLEFLPDNFIEEFAKIKLFGKPLMDPFELVILELYEKKATIESNLNIKGYSYLSSYCNGNGYLFLSGGDSITKKAEASTAFTSIELSTRTVENYNMTTPRKCHSMIYIPGRYVFIIGGTGTTQVDYFNQISKTFSKHSNLNKERFEPSLALVDNAFLYALNGFKHKDTVNQFERINLRSDSVIWENITINVDPDLHFTQHFFGVAQYKDNQLIFIGGVDHDSKKHIKAEPDNSKSDKCALFNYDKCTLSVSPLSKINEEFAEKFFIPYDSEKSYQLPFMTRDNIRVYLLADEQLKDIKFDPDQP